MSDLLLYILPVVTQSCWDDGRVLMVAVCNEVLVRFRQKLATIMGVTP